MIVNCSMIFGLEQLCICDKLQLFNLLYNKANSVHFMLQFHCITIFAIIELIMVMKIGMRESFFIVVFLPLTTN